jgi:glycerol-3-phosphate acyltransferase PlsY
MLQTIISALENSWLAVILTAISAYLLGSISSAVIVSKKMYKEDVREKGSGNAGATNVLRSYGKKAALYTTIGDFLKAVVAVLLGGFLLTQIQLTGNPMFSQNGIRIVGWYLAGACCVLGHLYPLYFGFKGGKGVMTSFGMIMILDYRVGLICFAVFCLTLVFSRMVSLSSVLAVAVAPFWVWFFRKCVDHYSNEAVAFCVTVITVVVLTIIFKHRSNLVRIAKGTESKFSFSKAKP